MSKHTPGPWEAHFEEAYYVTGPDRGRVAMMLNLKGAHGLGGRRTGEESAANARLIAAAPETAAERDTLREINAELLFKLISAANYIKNLGGDDKPYLGSINKAKGGAA
jgi:hypothetical protein